MPAKIHLTREKIIAAMKVTQSGLSCARHLGINWHTLRDYAKLYKTDDGTQTLHEAMKNPSALGIPKFRKEGGRKQPAVLDIIEGRVPASVTTPQKLKYRLVEEGYLEEKCSKCGYKERRVLDYRMPLILNHKNNKKNDFNLKNIELLCYNCYFLFCANVLSDRDIEQVESHKQINNTTEAVNWELDDYHLQRLKELGLYEEEDSDDPNSLVSRR